VKARFARAVRRLARRAEFAEDAADGHEAPGTTHHGESRVEREVGAKQVRVEDGARPREPHLVVRGTGAPHGKRACHAGVGDHEVEPAPRLQRTRHGGPRVGGIPHVAGEVPRLSPSMRDLAYGLPERALVAPRRKDAGATGGELEGDGPADPLASAGDDRDMPVEQSRRRHGVSP